VLPLNPGGLPHPASTRTTDPSGSAFTTSQCTLDAAQVVPRCIAADSLREEVAPDGVMASCTVCGVVSRPCGQRRRGCCCRRQESPQPRF
jgi:hypothetical protein